MGIRHRSLRQSAEPWVITAWKLFFHTTIIQTDRLLIGRVSFAYYEIADYPQSYIRRCSLWLGEKRWSITPIFRTTKLRQSPDVFYRIFWPITKSKKDSMRLCNGRNQSISPKEKMIPMRKKMAVSAWIPPLTAFTFSSGFLWTLD